MKIAIIFDSYNGHTEKVAQAMAEGARDVPGAEVRCQPATETTEEDLLWAEGIALGSPTHMGSMGWQMKQLIDARFSPLWMKNALVGKVGAVFNTGGSGGAGGAELTLLSLLSNLAENGMILLSHPRNAPGYKPDGMHWGPTCVTGRGDLGPKDAHLEAARAHGKRLAEVTRALHPKSTG